MYILYKVIKLIRQLYNHVLTLILLVMLVKYYYLCVEVDNLAHVFIR